MVLQNVDVAQHPPKFGSGLLDDRREGNAVDHTPHAAMTVMGCVMRRVFQREPQGGQGFSAAGRHGQAEESWGQCRLAEGLRVHLPTQCIDGRGVMGVLTGQFLLMVGQPGEQLSHAALSGAGIFSRLRF